MSFKTKSIAVLGGGFIGKVLKRYYPDAVVYDKNPELSECGLGEALSQDTIFIAFNLLDNAIDSLNEVRFYLNLAVSGRTFIIKSTFVPGTSDKLQSEFPEHRIIYNPEFLTEMTAWEDFTKPKFQILGVPHESLPIAYDVFDILPDAPIKRIISPLDAELLKHALNSYYALKVTWFNQLYDVAKQLGADYETVREIMVKDPWVGDSHSVIFHKGYRGYGGKCLSKDPVSLSRVVKFPLIEQMEEYNKTIKNKS